MKKLILTSLKSERKRCAPVALINLSFLRYIIRGTGLHGCCGGRDVNPSEPSVAPAASGLRKAACTLFMNAKILYVYTIHIQREIMKKR